MAEEISGSDVLAIPMGGEGSVGGTVKDYLKVLLRMLWHEQEGFNGKRPIVIDGDWEYDLYIPLAKAGLIEAKFDEDGYLDDVDAEAGNKLIKLAIEAL